MPIAPVPSGDRDEEAVTERLLAKIHKLLALAGSSNEHEAAAAASKAQALMFAHGLDLASLEAGLPVAPGVVARQHGDPRDADAALWYTHLIGVIAETTLCRLIVRRETRPVLRVRFLLIGRPADVEVASLLADALVGRLSLLADTFVDAARADLSLAMRRPIGAWESLVRRDFLTGAVETVAKRLKDDFAARRAADASSMALVEVREGEIEDYLDAHHRHRRKTIADLLEIDASPAYRAGISEGATVDLSVPRPTLPDEGA